MRIWSLHPKYLDSKGLVALWRETLLAKNVLEGKTRGYKMHPQLNRFKESPYPLASINYYLAFVYEESIIRQYNFNKEKINWDFTKQTIEVTKGQLRYESQHLIKKLQIRDKSRYNRLKHIDILEAHPMFVVISGEIEDWEIQ